MSNPPSRSSSGMLAEPAATPTASSYVEQPDRPLLYKTQEDITSLTSHADKNNDNEAV